MANFSGRYFKVWKIENQNGMKKVNLGDSEKQKDGSYRNWTWFGCLLAGNAKNIPVNENDTIEVKSGIISQKEYNGKWYTNIVIFDFVVTKSAQSQQQNTPQSPAPAVDFEDDIPF